MDAAQFAARLPNAAMAFRGYNLSNLGRSHELLEHPLYGDIVDEYLRESSEICSTATGRRLDLVERVRQQRETTLDSYAEAIAMIVAMELAQLRILSDVLQIDPQQCRLSMGYSLGEIAALVAGGVFSLAEALQIPLSMASDCVELAHDVTLGILFSRGDALPFEDVQRMCLQISSQGRGTVGVSCFLSPNSLLLMGQGSTLDEFRRRMCGALPAQTYLRKNKNCWPPLHTPIVWQKNIPTRAAVLMQTLEGGFTKPEPPILSLVTGKISYNDYNARELLQQWIDHPQRLWEGVYDTLARGIDMVVHVGPEPNLVPATFKRLRDNVEVQTRGRLGMRALSAAVRRPWLKSLLPQRTALLRAPLVEHVVLEDFLLEQPK